MKIFRPLRPGSNYTTIDNWFLFSEHLSAEEKVLLFKLQAYDWTGNGRECSERMKEILQTSTDREVFADLQEIGLVVRTPYGFQVSGVDTRCSKKLRVRYEGKVITEEV